MIRLGSEVSRIVRLKVHGPRIPHQSQVSWTCAAQGRGTQGTPLGSRCPEFVQPKVQGPATHLEPQVSWFCAAQGSGTHDPPRVPGVLDLCCPRFRDPRSTKCRSLSNRNLKGTLQPKPKRYFRFRIVKEIRKAKPTGNVGEPFAKLGNFQFGVL